MAASTVPELPLGSSGLKIPALGFGTVAFPPVGPEATKEAILTAIEVGYRHFDTALLYGTEQPLGEAISEALRKGLIKSRDELFITSKLWLTYAFPDHVLPGLRQTLQNLQLDYVDLFLLHWPLSMKPGKIEFPLNKEDFMPLDLEQVWAAMEDCQRKGLTKTIGVSNFSSKKLTKLLTFAKIPPANNQVEMHPFLRQKELIEFCKAHQIVVTAYSPLGAKDTPWGGNRVMDCDVLKEIAERNGKSVAQVCLRWMYEQGVVSVPKSFNKDRMKQNLEIFSWELSEEDHKKINQLQPQVRQNGSDFISDNGPFKTPQELWDE